MCIIYLFLIHAGRHAKTAGLLVAMVVPGSLVFLVIINFAEAGHTSLSFRFLFTYLTLSIIQVSQLGGSSIIFVNVSLIFS